MELNKEFSKVPHAEICQIIEDLEGNIGTARELLKI